MTTFLTGIILGGLAGFILGLLVAIAISVYEDRPRRIGHDYDDSWERLASRLRHPTQRVP